MKLYSIQYLRCLAMLLTVGIHLFGQLERMGYDGRWETFLPSGVDLFFIISGFIMWITTYGRDTSPLAFFYRRITRIVPLYWIVTSVMVLVMLVAPGAMQSSRFELSHVIASYLFIPAVHPVLTDYMEPVLVPGWTLNYEALFYVIFGCALLLRPRARLTGTIAVLLLLVGLQVFGIPDLTLLSFYTSSVILEFALGLLLGVAYTGGWTLPRPATRLMLVLGFAGLVGLSGFREELPRLLIWGLPGFLIVSAAVFAERNGAVPRFRLITLLGDASYSVYLSHGLALSAVSQGWRLFGLADSSIGLVAFALLGALVSVVFGVLVYYFVERPIIRFFRPRGTMKEAATAP